MNIQVTVDLVSTFKKHGSSGAKPKKTRSRASSKFNAIMSLIRSNKSDGSDSPEEDPKKDSSGDGDQGEGAKGGNPKPYGSHAGNIHVKRLWVKTVTKDEDLDSVSSYIANATNYIETKHGFDLSAAKFNYRSHKDAITAAFAEKYGSKLSEETTSVYLDELSKYSFTYTQHQIRITIVSDVEIAGARKDPDSGMFILVIKSKMYCCKDKVLLKEDELRILMGLSKEEVNLRTSKLVRIPAILVYDAKTDRYVAQFKDNNFVVADSY